MRQENDFTRSSFSIITTISRDVGGPAEAFALFFSAFCALASAKHPSHETRFVTERLHPSVNRISSQHINHRFVAVLSLKTIITSRHHAGQTEAISKFGKDPAPPTFFPSSELTRQPICFPFSYARERFDHYATFIVLAVCTFHRHSVIRLAGIKILAKG